MQPGVPTSGTETLTNASPIDGKPLASINDQLAAGLTGVGGSGGAAR